MAPPAEAVLAVQVTPRASRNEISGWQGDVLRVRLTAPPVDGAANAALIAVLAGVLDVPKSAITIVAGHSGRRKRVRVSGLSRADLERRLAAAAD
jgi:uncharacterized protein (TIGR00251 family)